MLAVGVIIAGFSSIFTGLNFMVTVHRMRAPGMTWGRLPLFVWANYAASLIMILGTPVIAITLILLALERGFHIGIFDPKLGGDPVLFQHRVLQYRHRCIRLCCLGTPHVRGWHLGLFSAGLLTAELRRGHTFGGQ